MNCQRCSTIRGGLAVARIRDEILDLAVCAACAKEATSLRLHVEPLDMEWQREGKNFPAAA